MFIKETPLGGPPLGGAAGAGGEAGPIGPESVGSLGEGGAVGRANNPGLFLANELGQPHHRAGHHGSAAGKALDQRIGGRLAPIEPRKRGDRDRCVSEVVGHLGAPADGQFDVRESPLCDPSPDPRQALVTKPVKLGVSEPESLRA